LTGKNVLRLLRRFDCQIVRPRALSREELVAMSEQFTAIFERDESGAWIVHIREIRGCHTYGRSLHQARRRIREALSLWIDDADRATIAEEIRLPAAARVALNRARRARERADRERDLAQEETERTARTLLEDVGLGMRDAGELLGLSHQRIQQLVRS
jgi:predicted RNase H-like HicB family nuclease